MKIRLATFTLLLSTAMAAFAGPLDGTTWKITVTPDKEAARKGEQPFEDQLIFAGDKVTSTTWATRGFFASSYQADRRGRGFSSQLANVSDGSASLTGAIKGDDSISGKISWRKKDGARLGFTFNGTKE